MLRAELPSLGFEVVENGSQATFDANVRYSDFSPVELDISLNEVGTGRLLWRARLVRKWDIYASVVSASERNALRAVALLKEDLAKLRGRK